MFLHWISLKRWNAYFILAKIISQVAPQGAIDHFIPVEEGVQIGARFFLGKPLNSHILFFHGRDEIVSDYNDIGLAYNRYSLSFLVVDYREYG